jgi:hypothetical protein
MGDAKIVVKVLKADKVRNNAIGEAPDPMVKLRINVGTFSRTSQLMGRSILLSRSESWS